MFEFCGAEPEDFGFGLWCVGDCVLVRCCLWLTFYGEGWCFSSGGYYFPIFWAVVVFWQSMLSAVVLVAEGAFER